jgi:hypothetical protein
MKPNFDGMMGTGGREIMDAAKIDRSEFFVKTITKGVYTSIDWHMHVTRLPSVDDTCLSSTVRAQARVYNIVVPRHSLIQCNAWTYA